MTTDMLQQLRDCLTAEIDDATEKMRALTAFIENREEALRAVARLEHLLGVPLESGAPQARPERRYHPRRSKASVVVAPTEVLPLLPEPQAIVQAASAAVIATGEVDVPLTEESYAAPETCKHPSLIPYGREFDSYQKYTCVDCAATVERPAVWLRPSRSDVAAGLAR